MRLKVKEIAESKGISMGKLARMADVTYKVIKKIYDEPTATLNTYTLEKIAKALGVPVRDLIEDE